MPTTNNLSSVKPNLALLKQVAEVAKSSQRFTNIADSLASLMEVSSSGNRTKNVGTAVKMIHSMLQSELQSQILDHVSIEQFFEYITKERLKHMPHPGSKLDRILNCADFFGLQISRFAEYANKSIPKCDVAASLAWSCCISLLKLGHSQIHALDTAFVVFYSLGSSLAFLLQKQKLIGDSTYIREEMGNAYIDIVSLTADVAVNYQKQLREAPAGTVTLNFMQIFGHTLDLFYRRKDAIVEAMWSLELQRNGKEIAVDIGSLREWLGPSDRVSTSLASSLRIISSPHEEYTCEWFEPHLLEFARSGDECLTVVGTEGCGKSVLADWIEQRLYRIVARRSHETMSFSFDNAENDNSSLSFLKNIALQLLERNVGDVEYYFGLTTLYEHCMTSGNPLEIEERLWKTLSLGFKIVALNRLNMIILVDGIDAIEGGEPKACKFFQQLYDLTAEYRGLKGIITMRPISLPSTKRSRVVTMTPEDIYQDIRRVVRNRLDYHGIFSTLTSKEQESIVERLLTESKNSFMYSILLTDVVMDPKTREEFTRAVEILPQDQETAIARLVATQLGKDSGIKQIFSWITVAERPLTILNIKTLLQIDVQHVTISDREDHTVQRLADICSSLLTFRNGMIQYRTRSVKQEFLKLSQRKKYLLSTKEINEDMTVRLLIFAKIAMKVEREPSFQPLDLSTVATYFHSNDLLEYAVKFWPVHFLNSNMINSDGRLHLPKGFKGIFPNSTMFALLEWSSWSTRLTKSEQLKFQSLALEIRRATFGNDQKCVLQALVIVALQQRGLDQMVEAADSFYKACKLCQNTLEKWSTLSMNCAIMFLSCTESVRITSRTDVMLCREELIIYIVKIYEDQYGATSDLVIKYKKMLAQLYLDIKEEDLAVTIYQQLYEISVRRKGKKSIQETVSNQDLVTVLEKGSKTGETVQYTRSVFGIPNTSTAGYTIEASISRAESYEQNGQLKMAEEIYLTLWQKSTKKSFESKFIDFHRMRIDSALAYSKFLERHKRKEESSSALLCLWNEYEDHNFSDEKILERFRVIGESMISVGLFVPALSLFASVSKWYKNIGRTNTKEFTSINALLDQTSQKVFQNHDNLSTHGVTITWSETALLQAYEMSMARSTATMHLQTDAISTCMSLITLYESERRWKEAISIARGTLCVLRPWVISGEGVGKLPHEYTSEAFKLSLHLAKFFKEDEKLKEAEQISVRIYQACKSTLSIKDERMAAASDNLLQFYEKYRQHGRLIDLYNEILTDYRRSVGGNPDEYTVKILYTLGGLCMIYRPNDVDGYYREILTCLNKSSSICHPDAMKSATILFNNYYEAAKWTEFLSICDLLWTTLIQNPKREVFTQDFVVTLYERYIQVLQQREERDSERLYKISLENRDSCEIAFGIHAEITIKAMIQLVKICDRYDKYHEKSFAIYQELLDLLKNSASNKTLVSLISAESLNKQLSELTRKISLGEQTLSKETLHKCISISSEGYERLKESLGASHNLSILKLRDLCFLHQKIGTHDSRLAATSALLEATVNILTTETSSTKLHEAAKQLGQIFIECKLPEYGMEILQELKSQILSPEFSRDNQLGIQISPSIGRQSYVFLVVLEEILDKHNLTYSAIMARNMVQALLYNKYITSHKSGSTETILGNAARLRTFLLEHNEASAAVVVENHSFDAFMKSSASTIKARKEISFEFFIGLLEELCEEGDSLSLGRASSIFINRKLSMMLEERKFQDAYELAQYAFDFVKLEKAYDNVENVGYGFKLSSCLACRVCTEMVSPKELRQKMLALSLQVIREVFRACKKAQIDFTAIKLSELNELVGLLGDQENYFDLDWLLTALWNSRESRKDWSYSTVIYIGQCLVWARFSRGDAEHMTSAIRVAEDICYNVCRVWGRLDSTSISMHTLLASLYNSTGRFRDAMDVHEEILRLEASGGDDDHDGISTDPNPVQTVRTHLNLLRNSYAHLGGLESRDQKMYTDLVRDLARAFPSENLDAVPVEKWSKSAKDSTSEGMFFAPKIWELGGAGLVERKRAASHLVERSVEHWGRSAESSVVAGGD